MAVTDQSKQNLATAATAAQTGQTTPAAAQPKQEYDSTQPVRSQASVNYTPAGLADPNNLKEYNANREQQIRNLYNTAQENTLAGYKTAYDQNLAALQQQQAKIAPQYQTAMNQLSAEYERQKRNTNMQGAANGLNTGAGSQLALGQSVANQQAQGSLARSREEAINDSNNAIANLQMDFQNQIAQAIANNNYQLAAALYQEFGEQYNRQMQIENLNYERAQQAEQQAYTRAYNEENRDYSRQFNEEARDYSRQRDTIADERYADELAYARGRDTIADQRYADELAYARGRDEVSDQRYAEELAYNRAFNEENRDYTRAFNENQRDYERAYNEENRDYTRNWNENERDYTRQNAEAQKLADYGDFSGYAKLYGEEAASAMKVLWEYQNPLLAFNLGQIDRDRYYQLTGQWPWEAAVGGGDSGGGGGGSSGGGDYDYSGGKTIQQRIADTKSTVKSGVSGSSSSSSSSAGKVSKSSSSGSSGASSNLKVLTAMTKK